LWLHSLKVAQLLRSAACLHTNQSRSYLNHLVYNHLSPWSSGLLENLIAAERVDNFFAFFKGTLVFIDVFTRAHYCNLRILSQLNPIHNLGLLL